MGKESRRTRPNSLASAAKSAAATGGSDEAKIAAWRETKVKEWSNTNTALRSKYPTRQQLDGWMDAQCAKVLAQQRAKQQRGAGVAAGKRSAAAATTATAVAPAKTPPKPKPEGEPEPPYVLHLLLLAGVLYWSYRIRLGAVYNYGRVIHEFDPWFNYRATEYMSAHGLSKFLSWFDHMSWYPLGRPIGTTTYPGMMLTASLLHRFINDVLGVAISLNDVCVFIPAGFSCITVLCVYLLTLEVSRSNNAGLCAAFLMALLPAHLMRSVAGGYDNESVAVAAICSTFFLWVRSQRNDSSWYIYMAGAWGGYTFVLNMIGVHAAVSVLVGNYSRKLHHAYTLFFLIGTAGALQVPVIGWQPLQSLEQLGPLAVFAVMQLLYVGDLLAGSRASRPQLFQAQVMVVALGVVAAAVAVGTVMPAGYLGPVSSRVRGLFIKHTKTGNPLVDSVAEHQATPPRAYWRYFHVVTYLGPAGLFRTMYKDSRPRTQAEYFLGLYCLVAWYFSQKMIRLVLLLAPAGAATGGIGLAWILAWCYRKLTEEGMTDEERRAKLEERNERRIAQLETIRTQGMDRARADAAEDDPFDDQEEIPPEMVWGGSVLLLFFTLMGVHTYVYHCTRMSEMLSEPQIMTRMRNSEGAIEVVDDYRDVYWCHHMIGSQYLRDHTAPDARVMAWWDYGYQITGVGNRTSIADGNTWNHEHIALLGRALVSAEEPAYEIARHMADYVLVVSTRHAGQYGDDLAKMPHMARIAGSVFDDIDASSYHQDREGNPSEKMRDSLLYRLHSYGVDKKIGELKYFEEAHSSPRNMVRVFKVKNVDMDSKRFVQEKLASYADGEWYRPGAYPPALQPTLALSKSFRQLEDFNRK